MPERINAGHALAAIGAIVLLVALFLDWYDPGYSAWTVFEMVDLVLAVVAAATLLAAAEEFVRRPRAPIDAGRWLAALAAVALLLVVVSIVNNPPAVDGRGEEAGAWVALAGAILMAVGALLADRRISLVISAREPARRPSRPRREPTGPATEPPGSDTETKPL